MRTIVDLSIVRDNLKNHLNTKLFSWIDVRNNFYNFGLNLLEDLIKYNNIGIFTNTFEDALKIRNINKSLPIILTNIKNIEQAYDLVVNDITLVIKDYNQLEEIANLNIIDKLSIMLQIDINNYEDGIKCKNFSKVASLLEKNSFLNLAGVYVVVNDKKNNLDDFKELIDKEQLRAFVIGDEVDFVSDGFVSKDLFSNAIRYELNVDKCFKLTKNDLFINKKIKKECYGIRIKADNIDLSLIDKVIIGSSSYKTIKTNHNTLFMIGKDVVKAGKKVDITSKVPNNCYTNWPVVYILNGKGVNLSIFD